MLGRIKTGRVGKLRVFERKSIIKSRGVALLLCASLLLSLAACSGGEIAVSPAGDSLDSEGQVPSENGEPAPRPAGWSEETHGNSIDPDYEVVFPQDRVNQLKITISPDDWKAMQSNMTGLFGARGVKQPGAVPGDGGRPDAGGLPGGGRGGFPSENPMWVPATVEFNGMTWTNVGVRYKGNSSLRSGWSSGTLELPLKLDFDEFEDEYPEIEDQRFYGFKQLSLSNSFGDGTYMRDKITAELLEEAGLVAAETAYYNIILDYGGGPVDLGIYVVIEVIDDTVINHYFSDDSGNIYEGDGPGVSLEEGTSSRIQGSFLKENNRQEADWSDIEALYDVLHSGQRTSDPGAWRKSLESIFDVDAFLEWLAISAIIQNWDTYGSMSHNFYLYHDPETGLLTWISWDHNMVLGVGGRLRGDEREMEMRGGAPLPGGGMRDSVSLDRADVGDEWPLIRYLLDDPTYYEQYVQHIEETINGAFNPGKMEKRCRELAELIAPYAAPESGATAFETAVENLISRIYECFQAAADFLAAGS